MVPSASPADAEGGSREHNTPGADGVTVRRVLRASAFVWGVTFVSGDAAPRAQAIQVVVPGRAAGSCSAGTSPRSSARRAVRTAALRRTYERLGLGTVPAAVGRAADSARVRALLRLRSQPVAAG